MKRVTTVIVNYRLKFFLEQTLLSVEEAYTEVDGRTIVIDNNSGDDSIDFLEERFPSVTFIRNKENVGFARHRIHSCSQPRHYYWQRHLKRCREMDGRAS